MSKVIDVMASIPRDTMAMAFRRAFNRIEALVDDGGTTTTNKNTYSNVHFQKVSLKFIHGGGGGGVNEQKSHIF
jgi:hypothetical protein